LRLPWGWNTGELGPPESEGYGWNFGVPDTKELLNPEIEPIARKYLELRYRLMPYLYSAVREAHETGMPVIRALWLHYPQDPRAVERGDQYLWGRDILVAPVTEQGAAARLLYLPQDSWYDLWTEERVEGGRTILRAVDLATMPLYVRAGAILPFGPVRQYTSEPSDEPITFVVYPGADGAFSLYEDDGTTFDYEKGNFLRLNVTWSDARRTLALELDPSSKPRPPMPRRFKIRLAGTEESREILFTGARTEVGFDRASQGR
jgi:alpha-glucosidase/alpha-D-xyloside xylohydrolase